MKRFLMVGMVLALFLAACGGDSVLDAPATTAGAAPAIQPAGHRPPAAETTAASSTTAEPPDRPRAPA